MSVYGDDPQSEHRRLKRMALEEQLRQLDDEDVRFQRASQAPPDFSALTASSSRHSHSRYPNQWASGSNDRSTSSASWARSDQSAQPLKHTSLHASYYDEPGPSTLPSSASSHTNNAYPHSSPSYTSHQMPGSSRQMNDTPPITAAQRSQPVPSKAQVNDYLIRYMKQPEGLRAPWSIDGYPLDVYALFNSVIQIGGSSKVTSRDLWPSLAVLIGFPVYRETSDGPKSSSSIGNQLRQFFSHYMNGLEVLWERTKAADADGDSHNTSSPGQHNVVGTMDNSSRGTWQQSLPTPVSAISTSNSPAQPHMSSYPHTWESSAQASGSAYQAAEMAHPIPSQPSVASIANLLSAPVGSQSATSTPAGPSKKARAKSKAAVTNSHQARKSSPAQKPPYDPPIVSSFDELVNSNLLPLPKLGAEVKVPSLPTASLNYAWRAHELRVEIRKMTMNEQHRHLATEELLFWNKLLMLLKKNAGVSIPKPSNFGLPRDTLANPSLNEQSRAIVDAIRAATAQSLENQAGAASATQSTVPESAPLPVVKGDQTTVLGDKTANRKSDNSEGRPRGRPPKLDADGNRITKPKAKRPRNSGTGDGSDSGATVIAEDTAMASSSTSASAPLPTPVSSTPAADFLRRLQTQNRSKQPGETGFVPPMSIDPSLLHFAQAGLSTNTDQEPAEASAVPDEITAQPASNGVNGSTSTKVHGLKSRWDKLKADAANGDVAAQEYLANYKATQSARAKARWQELKARGEAGSPALPNGGSQKPKKLKKSHSQSSLPSPRKTIDLSGGHISKARLRSIDLETPTRITGLKGLKKRTPSIKPTLPSPLSRPDLPAPDPSFEPSTHHFPLPLPSSLPDAGSAGPSTLAQAIRSAPATETDLSADVPPVTMPMEAGSVHGPTAVKIKKPSDTKLQSSPFISQSQKEKAKPKAAKSRHSELFVELHSSQRETQEANPPIERTISDKIAQSPATRPFASVSQQKPVNLNKKRMSTPVTRSSWKPHRSSRSTPLERSVSQSPSSSLRRRVLHRVSPSATRSLRQSVTRSTRRVTPQRSTSSQTRDARESSVRWQGTVSSNQTRAQPVIELLTSPKAEIKRQRRTRPPVDRAKVVIPITRGRRARLIRKGYYDAFRDDDSDDEEVTRRSAHIPHRPLKPLPRGSLARIARPSIPENIPDRFFQRPGPGIIEPYKSVLSESTLLKRLFEHPCGWKGCESILASEDLLEKHVKFRRHIDQAKFAAGIYGTEKLWRCHWKCCEEPCFSTRDELWQHLKARHISKNLKCPYHDCDLTSPNISHLARHVMKQHDDDPEHPLPLADLSTKLPPLFPLPENQPLPEEVRTDQLTLPTIQGTVYSSIFRREWAKAKVANNCFQGDDPIMHVEHPPHILERVEGTPETVLSEDEDESTYLDDKDLQEQKLLDKADRVKRSYEPVVLLHKRTVPFYQLSKVAVDTDQTQVGRKGASGEEASAEAHDVVVKIANEFIDLSGDGDVDPIMLASAQAVLNAAQRDEEENAGQEVHDDLGDELVEEITEEVIDIAHEHDQPMAADILPEIIEGGEDQTANVAKSVISDVPEDALQQLLDHAMEQSNLNAEIEMTMLNQGEGAAVVAEHKTQQITVPTENDLEQLEVDVATEEVTVEAPEADKENTVAAGAE